MDSVYLFGMEPSDFLDSKTPIGKLEEWFSEAQRLDLREPRAMTLSTVDSNGHPSSRVVLVKEIRPDGLVFYTNYNSRKGRDLQQNPKAAANLYWDSLQKQIKIQGSVIRLSIEESQDYWQQRPRASQLSQITSQQSSSVASRQVMEREYIENESKFAAKEIPCPLNWGGLLLQPTTIEFWIGHPDRFHDRFEYKKEQGQWLGCRLYP